MKEEIKKFKDLLSYYCLNCRKNTESKDPKKDAKTKNVRIMLLSNCVVCDSSIK